MLLGSFDRCEICYNAEVLLKNTRGLSHEGRDIIKVRGACSLFVLSLNLIFQLISYCTKQAYRRRHIQKQFDERIKLQENIKSTYEFDINGQPLTALLFADGMTVVKGEL